MLSGSFGQGKFPCDPVYGWPPYLSRQVLTSRQIQSLPQLLRHLPPTSASAKIGSKRVSARSRAGCFMFKTRVAAWETFINFDRKVRILQEFNLLIIVFHTTGSYYYILRAARNLSMGRFQGIRFRGFVMKYIQEKCTAGKLLFITAK